MAGMTQAQARQAAIQAGADPAEVDAFITSEGGARTSAQRITSAFGVSGSMGTNDLSTFHAQKATVAGADASGQGTYLSGGTSPAMTGLAGAGTNPVSGGSGGGIPPAVAESGLTGLGDSGGLGGGGGAPEPSASQLMLGGQGVLRQNLGHRQYPQESNALAGLRKAY